MSCKVNLRPTKLRLLCTSMTKYGIAGATEPSRSSGEATTKAEI